jgi:hypothetical protein
MLLFSHLKLTLGTISNSFVTSGSTLLRSQRARIAELKSMHWRG